MRNPFKPYPTGRGPVRLLIYGEPGTEKTRRALQMPGPVYMIDMEKGGDEYGAIVPPGSQYMTCGSHAALSEALDYLLTLNPAEVGTVIIDPITVVWQSLQAGTAETLLVKERRKDNPRWTGLEEVVFDQGVWSRLNRVHGDIMATLINAPWHVVMIARGKELKSSDGSKVVGYGFEGHKSLDFLAKTVVQSRRDHDVVVKDRSGSWREGKAKRLDLRDLVANSGKGGAKLETPSEAAKRDSTGEHHPSWEADKGRLFAELGRLGMEYSVVAEACESVERPRPSGMTIDQRRKLIQWLGTDEGRAAYERALSAAAERALTQGAA